MILRGRFDIWSFPFADYCALNLEWVVNSEPNSQYPKSSSYSTSATPNVFQSIFGRNYVLCLMTIMSVPKYTANLYCICLGKTPIYTCQYRCSTVSVNSGTLSIYHSVDINYFPSLIHDRLCWNRVNILLWK